MLLDRAGPCDRRAGRRVPAGDHVGDDPDDLRQRAAQLRVRARPADLRHRDHRARRSASALLANYAFVFGNLGAPALGLEGSALASVLTALFVLARLCRGDPADRRLRRYRLFGNWWRPEWWRFGELVRTGLPVAATILAEAGLFSGAAFLMGLIGAAQLAGHTIALQVAALAFQMPFGIGQAATIRVGYHYGARDRRRSAAPAGSRSSSAPASWC